MVSFLQDRRFGRSQGLIGTYKRHPHGCRFFWGGKALFFATLLFLVAAFVTDTLDGDDLLALGRVEDDDAL